MLARPVLAVVRSGTFNGHRAIPLAKVINSEFFAAARGDDNPKMDASCSFIAEPARPWAPADDFTPPERPSRHATVGTPRLARPASE